HEQYRSSRSSSVQVQFVVPSSEVNEQHLGEGVGCGRAHREVRQWGSKPEQTQDGQRGWLPKRGADTGLGNTSSTKVFDPRGKNGGADAIRIARAESLSPGTAGHR
ncbi:hypothetical protein, partial [Streptomyces sp. NPDC005752]|uniref:hypothetical protein n=1 Tax=Streptomyces sp. NPDC005752 TaxID=3157065 RepID=UPI00340E4FBC